MGDEADSAAAAADGGAATANAEKQALLAVVNDVLTAADELEGHRVKAEAAASAGAVV